MKKKIHVKELRLGMYIDKLAGNWLQHPFWKSAFLLKDEKDIKAIKKSGISHIWIDTSKGKDVASSQSEKVEEKISTPTQVDESTHKNTVQATPLHEEIKFAQETLEKAKQATVSMFQEARMGKSIEVTEAQPLVDEISQSVMRNPGAMLSLTRIKNADDYTYMHSVAVCALMIALGKQLNYQGDLHSLGMAGLLHDVGKMGIPLDILNKPDKLTEEEFNIVKNHPMKGWQMLKDVPDVDDITRDVCLHHHEKIDGTGYPKGLANDEISLVAKMGAICDVYDAITSDRCYKKGWEPAIALKRMAEWKEGHFDDIVFNAFVKTIGIYPTGTLIKLKSGRLGVVTEQSKKSLINPQIKLFYSTTNRAPIPKKIIALGNSSEKIDSIESPETWGFTQEVIMSILS